MNRKEAIARGLEVHDTQHSMKRRSPWHDYHRIGTYMLTLVVDGRAPVLGKIIGNANAPVGSPDAPRVEYSELATAILNDEIGKINKYYPQVEVWKVCIMPDHIHMIIRISEDMPRGKHLGAVVRGFKTGCSRAWWRLTAGPTAPSGKAAPAVPTLPSGEAAPAVPTLPSGEAAPAVPYLPSGEAEGTVASAEGTVAATVPSAFPEGNSASPEGNSASPEGNSVPPVVRRPVLFESGYNDKILMHEGQLERWKAYLDDNPRRLLVKRQNPGLFTVIHGMKVAEHQCQVVGNRFLLDIPDKVAVIVHRRYTDAENARLREEWLACGERGGVLVSAAISPKEKEVLREAMNRGYRIILLRENGFPRLYKPSGESFNACSEGLLLQISPWEFHMEKKTITRAQCLELNAMAESIAGNDE